MIAAGNPRRRTKRKSNYEEHEEHKEKNENLTLWFLRELRAFRGDPSFEGKEITIKTLI
jgi:hypothetical protein